MLFLAIENTLGTTRACSLFDRDIQGQAEVYDLGAEIAQWYYLHMGYRCGSAVMGFHPSQPNLHSREISIGWLDQLQKYAVASGKKPSLDREWTR
jgi:hypothetical protein